MSEHIININSAELEFIETSYGEKFRVRSAPLASLVGAKKLGYRIAELEPGYRAWPFHSHHVNEEMFFVLNGIGKVRIGQFEYTIKTGDIISAPPGGAEHAHQIINNSNSTLRYLCVSTMYVISMLISFLLVTIFCVSLPFVFFKSGTLGTNSFGDEPQDLLGV